MSLELVYTSAPKGLGAGSGGFCTVAATAGLSRQILGKLEALSGYQFHFNLSDPKAKLNPVNYAHTRITVGAEPFSVLSRIGFCGADYSGRTNKIAHHFLLEHGEQLPGGPAWMLMELAQGTLVAGYSGDPKNLPKRDLRAAIPQAPEPTGVAAAWQEMTGDAGWAGMLVKTFRENPKVPAFVLFQPGQDLLPLFEESLALLPLQERWQVGFATYYTSLPAGCQYHWRGVLEGSPAAREITRFPSAVVIDLAKALGLAPDNEYAEAARTGRVLEAPATAERPRVRVVDRAQVVPVPTVGAATQVGEITPSALDFPPAQVPAFAPDDRPGAVRIDDYMTYVRRARWVLPLTVATLLFMIAAGVLAWFYSQQRTEVRNLKMQLAAQGGASKSPSATAKASPAAPPQQPAPEGKPQPESTGVAIDMKSLEALAQQALSASANAKAEKEKTEAAIGKAEEELKKMSPLSPDTLGQARIGLNLARNRWSEAEAASKRSASEAASADKHHSEFNMGTVQIGKVSDPGTKEKNEQLQSSVDLARKDADGAAKQASTGVSKIKTQLDNIEKEMKAVEDSPKVEDRLRKREKPWDGAESPITSKYLIGRRETGNLVFALSQKSKHFAFLLPPETVSSKGFQLILQTHPWPFTLYVKVAGGLGKEDLMTCHIDSQGKLICRFTEKQALIDQYRDVLKCLVIEVADVDAKKVVQCIIDEKRQPGKSLEKDIADECGIIPIPYPWPETIRASVGTAPPQLPTGTDSWRWPFLVKDNAICSEVILLLKRTSEKPVGVKPELVTLENIRNAASAIAEEWQSCETRRSQHKTDIQNKNNNIKNLQNEKGLQKTKKQRKDEIDNQIGNFNKEIGDLQSAISKIDSERPELEKNTKGIIDIVVNVIDKHKNLTICDAWDVPILTINLVFKKNAEDFIRACGKGGAKK